MCPSRTTAITPTTFTTMGKNSIFSLKSTLRALRFICTSNMVRWSRKEYQKTTMQLAFYLETTEPAFHWTMSIIPMQDWIHRIEARRWMQVTFAFPIVARSREVLVLNKQQWVNSASWYFSWMPKNLLSLRWPTNQNSKCNEVSTWKNGEEDQEEVFPIPISESICASISNFVSIGTHRKDLDAGRVFPPFGKNKLMTHNQHLRLSVSW